MIISLDIPCLCACLREAKTAYNFGVYNHSGEGRPKYLHSGMQALSFEKSIINL
jgi:hypothetical protein